MNISACCLSGVAIGGDGTTHYYVCQKCLLPCDVFKAEKIMECMSRTPSLTGYEPSGPAIVYIYEGKP